MLLPGGADAPSFADLFIRCCHGPWERVSGPKDWQLRGLFSFSGMYSGQKGDHENELATHEDQGCCQGQVSKTWVSDRTAHPGGHPKVTRCELQDQLLGGLGPRHHDEHPHSASFALHCSSEEEGRGGGGRGQGGSHMKFSGSGETRGQARFWSLLDVRCCYTYWGVGAG